MPAKQESSPARILRKRLHIRNHQGLHGRPAALFVKVAKQYRSTVRIRKGKREVDGKSIMGVLTLAAERGSPVELIIEGPDAREALRALEQLLSHQELPAVVNVVKHPSRHGTSSS